MSGKDDMEQPCTPAGVYVVTSVIRDSIESDCSRLRSTNESLELAEEAKITLNMTKLKKDSLELKSPSEGCTILIETILKHHHESFILAPIKSRTTYERLSNFHY
jgi:hypothetical protein